MFAWIWIGIFLADVKRGIIYQYSWYVQQLLVVTYEVALGRIICEASGVDEVELNLLSNASIIMVRMILESESLIFKQFQNRLAYGDYRGTLYV